MSLFQNLYRFYYAYRDFSSVHSADLEEKQKTERAFRSEFTNYHNALKDSKKYKPKWLKETQNNHLKLLDDRLNSYLDDHVYEYKDDNITLLSDRIDFAFALYTDESLSEAIRYKALRFLGYSLDIHEELLRGPNINETILHLMNVRNQHKESEPSYIPGRVSVSEPLLPMQASYVERDRREAIRYLESQKTEKHRVFITQGKFKKNNTNFDTSNYTAHAKPGWAACVLDPNGDFFVFKHTFGQGANPIKHSSFTKGGPVFFAGELIIRDGVLKAIAPMSGHYKPSLFQTYLMLEYLSDHGVDISQADVITLDNPSEYLSDVHSTVITNEYPKVFYLEKAGKEYLTPAREIYQSIHSKLLNAVQNIQQDIRVFWKRESSGLSGAYSFFQSRMSAGTSAARQQCIELAKRLDAELDTLLKEASSLPHKKYMTINKLERLERLITESEQAVSSQKTSPQVENLNSILQRAKQLLTALQSHSDDEIKRTSTIRRN